jgi:hypothetical protein
MKICLQTLGVSRVVLLAWLTHFFCFYFLCTWNPRVFFWFSCGKISSAAPTEVFLSGFQMGYDVGLGGWLLAGYYLAYSKIIICIPMYSTCLPTYLRAYLPIMYDSLLDWSLNYLRRSSNLLTYLLTYLNTKVNTYIPTYLHTYVPLYLHTCIIYIRSLVLSTYLWIVPAYLHTCMPKYLLYDSSLYIYC